MASHRLIFRKPAKSSSNSGNATTLIDTDFGFKTSAEMVGAILSIYTGSFTQRYATVSAWNDSTKTITFGSISANPDTGMRYYLTAGSGQTNALWMMTENSGGGTTRRTGYMSGKRVAAVLLEAPWSGPR
jgi:hypothetical protein